MFKGVRVLPVDRHPQVALCIGRVGRETAPRPPWNPTATSRGRNIRGGARQNQETYHQDFPAAVRTRSSDGRLEKARAGVWATPGTVRMPCSLVRMPRGAVRTFPCSGFRRVREPAVGFLAARIWAWWGPRGTYSPYSPVVGRRPCRGGSPRRLLRASSPSMWGARDAQNRQNVVCHFPRTPFLAHPPF